MYPLLRHLTDNLLVSVTVCFLAGAALAPRLPASWPVWTALVPIGLGAGRIGNFINAELWGKPTDLPWAMVFPPFSDPRTVFTASPIRGSSARLLPI